MNVTLKAGDLVTVISEKKLFLKKGKRLLELFTLGGLNQEGTCQIVHNLDDQSLAPTWLDQQAIKDIAETANERLLEIE